MHQDLHQKRFKQTCVKLSGISQILKISILCSSRLHLLDQRYSRNSNNYFFLIIINVENYFCGNRDTFNFFRDSRMNNTYNTVYVFTVTFDQFNVSLINTKKWRKNILIGNVTVSTKILCSTPVGNIDINQNFFLEQQISILLWFLKIMWHWRLQ